MNNDRYGWVITCEADGDSHVWLRCDRGDGELTIARIDSEQAMGLATQLLNLVGVGRRTADDELVALWASVVPPTAGFGEAFRKADDR
jgi:hypothetical protein